MRVVVVVIVVPVVIVVIVNTLRLPIADRCIIIEQRVVVHILFFVIWHWQTRELLDVGWAVSSTTSTSSLVHTLPKVLSKESVTQQPLMICQKVARFASLLSFTQQPLTPCTHSLYLQIDYRIREIRAKFVRFSPMRDFPDLVRGQMFNSLDVPPAEWTCNPV